MSAISPVKRKVDEQIEKLTVEVRNHIDTEIARDSAMAVQFEQLQKEFKVLNDTVTEIAGLLTQTKGALAFIKVLAAIVAAGAATWAWIISNLQTLHKG